MATLSCVWREEEEFLIDFDWKKGENGKREKERNGKREKERNGKRVEEGEKKMNGG